MSEDNDETLNRFQIPGVYTRRTVQNEGLDLLPGIEPSTRRKRKHELPESDPRLVSFQRLGSNGEPINSINRPSSAPPNLIPPEQRAVLHQTASSDQLDQAELNQNIGASDSGELDSPPPLGVNHHLVLPSLQSTPRRGSNHSSHSSAHSAQLEWESFDDTVVEVLNEIDSLDQPVASNMGDEIAVKHLMACDKAISQWDWLKDDLADLAARPVAYLENTMTDLRSLIQEVMTAQSYFRFNANNDYTADFQAETTDALRELKQLIKNVADHLKNRNSASNPATPVQSIQSSVASSPTRVASRQCAERLKRKRISDMKTTLTTSMDELTKEFDDLRVIVIDSDADVFSLDAKIKKYTTKFKSLKEKAKDLLQDAIEVADDDVADSLDKNIRSLDTAKDKADEFLQEAQDDRGFTTTPDGISKAKRDVLTIPTFSGDPLEDDFYTFRRKFEEYTASVNNMTSTDRVHLLKNKCLSGDAKMTAQAHDELDKCWDQLSVVFGNVPAILNEYRRQLNDIGSCPGGKNIKQRLTWYIKVKTLLIKARQFAIDNNVTSDLYVNNGMHVETRMLMLYTDSNEVGRKFRELTGSNGIQQVEACYQELINYLSNEIDVASSDMSVFSAVQQQQQSKGSQQQQQQQGQKAKQNQGEKAKSDNSKKVYSNMKQGQKQGNGQKQSNNSNQQQKQQNQPTPPLQQTGSGTTPAKVTCLICNQQHTHFLFCEKFLLMSMKERLQAINKARGCRRCLRLDADLNFDDVKTWWNGHKNNCRTDFLCDKNKCAYNEHRLQRHILTCNFHREKNRDVLPEFTKAYPSLPVSNGLLHVSSMESSVYTTHPTSDDIIPDPEGPGIFMMQKILSPGGKVLHLFFDSGCGSAAMTLQAAKDMNSSTVRPGPTRMSFAGGKSDLIPGGDDCIYLPVFDGDKCATVIGVVMNQLTSEFPEFHLQTAYSEFSNVSQGANLPTVPDSIGGRPMDIILGIKYHHLFPQLLLTLPSGLALYLSPLKGADGHRGVLGGPHAAWRQAECISNHLGASFYFSSELRAYRDHVNCLYMSGRDWLFEEMEAKVLDIGEVTDDATVKETVMHARQTEKKYLDSENIGSEAPYRCPAHRNCSDCNSGETLEMTSFKEELEQSMIQQSVEYDFESKRLLATLPFVQDPVENLEPNRHIAQKILEGQLRKVNKQPEVKAQVLASHDKLVNHGHSVKFDELSEIEKKQIDDSPGDYFLPWRFVHKEGSLSTPVRCVFDASSKTPSGKSLNECLAKGQNKLEKIFSLLLNFRAGTAAFSCDIKMAYNQLQLSDTCRRWHKYLWVDNLDPSNPVHVRVMCTIIYGVISSGNQTSEGLQKLARFCQEHYPQHTLGAEVLASKTYVDDASDAADSKEELFDKISGVDFTLSLGSMNVKSYIVSGETPHDTVAREGGHVSMLGYQWTPETDRISLEPKELYLGHSLRGKRPQRIVGDIKAALMKNFTRRIILGKVAGNFDPLGLYTPLTATFKLDYSELSGQNLGWDDGLPLHHLDKWARNLQMMQEMQKVTFPRSVVVSTNKVTLLTSVDASQSLAVACVHVRTELDDGSVIVRLAAAKSKIVKGSTIPRAELKAAVVGSILADTVSKNLKGKVQQKYFLTDSTIVLNWVHQDSRPMTIAVRNNVIEIRRFTDRHSWRHIETHNNIADLGTRSKATVESISETSDWQNGKAWMYLPLSEMPIKTVEEIKPTKDEDLEIRREIKPGEFYGHFSKDGFQPDKFCGHLIDDDARVQERYQFSNYLIDPCAKPFPSVINAMVYLRRFCYWYHPDKTKRSEMLPGLKKLDDPITEGERELSRRYFFVKGTREVKKFVPAKDYVDVTTEKDGVLYYNARILEGTEVTDMANIMTDIEPLQFCVPVLDRFSPLSYSVMMHSHAELSHHRNINTALLQSRTIAFIFRGRDLAKQIQAACVGCKRFKARLIEVEMAKIHPNRLIIAPPFYHCQVDLMGPFDAHCEHNHRATVKVWGAVFRDPACGAVSVHAMTDYSTDAFVAAFIRFSFARGYPAKLFIDAGSQLVKACNDLAISPADLTKTLNGKLQVGIEHEVAPTAAHNYQGCVERTIKEVKKIFQQVFSGLKFDVLNYETAFGHVANEINNLPIAIGSKVEDLGNVDLLTPARLLFGRNNCRAPVGAATISKPGRMVKQMEKLYESWWQVWLNEKLADYVPQPPTFRKTTYQPKVGDICVFLVDRGEAIHHEVWKLGRIVEASPGIDGVLRSVTIEYQNATEKVRRRTRRSLRKVAVLFSEDEISLTERLNNAAKAAAKHQLLQRSNSHTS